MAINHHSGQDNLGSEREAVGLRSISYHHKERRHVSRRTYLPALLSRKPFVEQSQDLGDIELDILQVKVLEVVFLHFQKIIEFQVKF